MEANRSKLGKQHYFLKIGGGNVHAQSYLQYNNKLVTLDKPCHSFHRARQALHVVISGIAVLANELKLVFHIYGMKDNVDTNEDIDDANDTTTKAIGREDNTQTKSVASAVEQIVFGALSKVELDDKQHPLLASF
jgi:hypothetical protein